jgi:RNA polymerase sigma factor (sigma-70 family)
MNATVLSIDDLIRHELPAARTGDHGAYGRIVAACQNTVTAVALAITRDVSASEDIAQEAFLSAWQHLERLHSPDSFLPWLRQITRNLARDHLRAHRNQPLDGPNAELVMAMAADPGPQPMQRMLAGEREMVAAELIGALPEDSRETLLLFYREGQSSQQVAALLGTTDSAVRKRLSRARQFVRDDMLRRFGEFAQHSAPSATLAASVMAGIVSMGKPTTAAAAMVGGSAMAGKSGLGWLGILDGSVIGGALSAYVYRRFLLGFAETPEERLAVLRCYNLYLITGVAVGFTAGLCAGLIENIVLTISLAMAASLAFSVQALMGIGRVMKPLLHRDAVRRPQNAVRRQLIYRLSFGPSGLIINNVAMFGAILMMELHQAFD